MNFSSLTFTTDKEPVYAEFMLTYNRQTTRWSCVAGISFCAGLIAFINYQLLNSFLLIAIFAVFGLALILTVYLSLKKEFSSQLFFSLSLWVSILYILVCFLVDWNCNMPPYFLPDYLVVGLLVCNTLVSFKLLYKLLGTALVLALYVANTSTYSPHAAFHSSQILSMTLTFFCIGWVSYLMERFKRLNFLKHEEMSELQQYLADGEANAKVGSWDWNFANSEIRLTAEMHRIFETNPSVLNGSVSKVMGSRIHPEDVERVQSQVKESCEHQTVLSSKYRLLLPDASIKHVIAQGKVYHDGKGKPIGIRGTVQDITEQEMVNISLEATKERLQRVITSSHEGVWELDLLHDALTLSDRWKELFGYQDEDLRNLQSNWKEFIHPDDVDLLSAAIRDLSNGNKSMFDFEYRIQHKDGNFRWTRLRCYATIDDAGKLIKLTGSNEDITDRKKIEQKLIDSESHLRAILQTEPECVKLLNRDGHLLDMNQAGLAMIEADNLEQVKGKQVFMLVAEEFRAAFNEMNRKVFEGESGKLEFRIHGIKGTERWLETNAVPLKDSVGKVTALLGVTRDITNRRIAEDKLRESELRFRTMADYAPVLIWMSGTDKLCTYFNKGWLTYVGRSIEQELGNGWAENVHPDDLQRCVKIYESHFDERKEFKMEYRLRRYDGVYRWIVDNGIPRYLANGEFVGYIGSCIEIHDIKESEGALLVSNREKDALIKEIHHRIKNNLQLVSSIIFIKMSVMDQGEYREFLGNMRHRIRSIAHIHERLLQTGSINKVNISDYLHRLLKDLVASLVNQELDIAVNINVEGIEVNPDTAIYCGLMINELVTNAFKHAFQNRRQGLITVVFLRENNLYTLLVSNNGCPMPEEIDPATSDSFGMQLLNVFITQLKATVKINRNNGTGFTVNFPIT